MSLGYVGMPLYWLPSITSDLPFKEIFHTALSVHVLKWFAGWSSSSYNWVLSIWISCNYLLIMWCHIWQTLPSIIPAWGGQGRGGASEARQRHPTFSCVSPPGSVSCWSLGLQVYTEIISEQYNYVGKEVQFCLTRRELLKDGHIYIVYIFLYVLSNN